MDMSDEYVNEVLNKAQQLLWGGSETENIEAHNLIAKLIKERSDANHMDSPGQMSVDNDIIPPINERTNMQEVIIAPHEYDANKLVTYKSIDNGNVAFPTIKVNELEMILEDKKRLVNKINSLQSQVNNIIDLLTENEFYDESVSKEEVLTSLCDILGYEPKKEIEFTATLRFTGRIDVDLSDSHFDLTDALGDIYVDIHNGDIVIDDYELLDAEEN